MSQCQYEMLYLDQADGKPVAGGGFVFDGGGKVCKLTVTGKKNKTTGLRPVKLRRVLLSNLAIECCAFRIRPADGT